MHVTRGSTHKEWLARTLTSWPADCSVAVVAVHSVEEAGLDQPSRQLHTLSHKLSA
jgi:hypothetical protein